jgi:hypothetical protein
MGGYVCNERLVSGVLRANWLAEMGPESNTIHVNAENVVVDE